MDKAFRDPAVLERPVGEVMEPRHADGRDRRAGRATWWSRLDRGPRCSCSTAAIRSACSPAQDVLAFLAGAARRDRPSRRAASRPAPSTRARSPIPTPARWSRRSRSRRRSRRSGRRAHAASSTRAAATRRAHALEACLASLEGARHGLAFASGMAAEDAVLRDARARRSRDHPERRLRRHVPARRRVSTRRSASTWSAVDLSDPGALARRLARHDTRGVDRDADEPDARRSSTSPRSPTLAHAARRARRGRQHLRDAVPPAAARARRRRRRALEHEVPRWSLRRRRRLRRDATTPSSRTSCGFLQNAVGAVPSPFDCYLVLRGIKTLARPHGSSLRERARDREMLRDHPAVERVLYPGCPTIPATTSRRGRCATSAAWSRSTPRVARTRALEVVARTGCSRSRSRSARSSR